MSGKTEPGLTTSQKVSTELSQCVVQQKLSNQDTNAAQKKVSFTLRCPISEVVIRGGKR